MFTGFVSYSSKANLGKKNHELEYENCQKQAYNLDFSSIPKKFRILHYYNTMQVRVPSKRREDIFIYNEINFYQFEIQNVTQLHMHDDNLINLSIYVKIYSIRMK